MQLMAQRSDDRQMTSLINRSHFFFISGDDGKKWTPTKKMRGQYLVWPPEYPHPGCLRRSGPAQPSCFRF